VSGVESVTCGLCHIRAARHPRDELPRPRCGDYRRTTRTAAATVSTFCRSRFDATRAENTRLAPFLGRLTLVTLTLNVVD